MVVVGYGGLATRPSGADQSETSTRVRTDPGAHIGDLYSYAWPFKAETIV